MHKLRAVAAAAVIILLLGPVLLRVFRSFINCVLYVGVVQVNSRQASNTALNSLRTQTGWWGGV